MKSFQKDSIFVAERMFFSNVLVGGEAKTYFKRAFHYLSVVFLDRKPFRNFKKCHRGKE